MPSTGYTRITANGSTGLLTVMSDHQKMPRMSCRKRSSGRSKAFNLTKSQTTPVSRPGSTASASTAL